MPTFALMIVASIEANILVVALATDVFAVAPTANVFVGITSLKAPVLDNSNPPLEWVLCIYHPMRFKKKYAKIKVILDSEIELNTITLAYTAKLGLKVQPTNVGAQKIDGSTLKIFGMALASF